MSNHPAVAGPAAAPWLRMVVDGKPPASERIVTVRLSLTPTCATYNETRDTVNFKVERNDCAIQLPESTGSGMFSTSLERRRGYGWPEAPGARKTRLMRKAMVAAILRGMPRALKPPRK